MPTNLTTDTIIAFSESFEGRDYLRTQINKFGLNVVCFENEAICFDNFKSISPKIVIVQTDSSQVVWRFIFAVFALRLGCPLLVLSDIVSEDDFKMWGVELPFYAISTRHQDDRLFMKVSDIIRSRYISGRKKHPPRLLGGSEAIKDIRSMLPSIASSMDPVLITGEQGTGKELLARLIAGHTNAEKVFIKIDCSELHPEMLLNNWLEKIMGIETKIKPIIIFFDGIHLISKEIQAQILLLMEGTANCKTYDRSKLLREIRFTASSEVMIEDLVKNGAFRKDLFYRLNVIPVHLPALRDRREDITLLMDYFIINACAANKKSTMIPSKKARETLFLYNWPGNVDELKTYMKRVSMAGNESCIFANNNIPKMRSNMRDYFFKCASTEDLPKLGEIKSILPAMDGLSLKRICEEFVARTEKKLMQKALESTNWNRKKAATLLNISYKSMLNKIKDYGMY